MKKSDVWKWLTQLKVENNIMSMRQPERGPLKQVPHTRIENEEEIEKYYKFGDTLGKGSFGTVVLAHRCRDESKWAVKIINKEKAGSTAVKLLEREVAIMKKVEHEHIIHLEEVLETPSKMFLVMELCDLGCLEDVITKEGPLTEQHALCIIRQLADAIAYIHENDIIHRDLKLDNILLAEPTAGQAYNIKLTDFGLSYTRGGSGSDYMMNQVVGTPIYMAPEVITNYGYSQQCDIWSVGVIMFKLISGIPPFVAPNEEELFDLIQKGDIKYTSSWKDVSQAAKQLIECMMKVDPAHRLTSKEILSHPWIMGKLDLDGTMTTNVLEMMKQYRLEQEELQEKERQNESRMSGDTSGDIESQNNNSKEVESKEDVKSSLKKSSSKKNLIAIPETSSALKSNSSLNLPANGKNEGRSSLKISERKSTNGTAIKPQPSYMQPNRSSRASKSVKKK